MANAKQIGEVIKEARKRKKIKQKQLAADVLHINVFTMSHYEHGKVKNIPLPNRAKLASVLNIPISDLLYDDEQLACISMNEAVDELKEQEKLIKAVNAELEEWLCSGDTDYPYKAMAIIRAEIDNEE